MHTTQPRDGTSPHPLEQTGPPCNLQRWQWASQNPLVHDLGTVVVLPFFLHCRRLYATGHLELVQWEWARQNYGHGLWPNRLWPNQLWPNQLRRCVWCGVVCVYVVCVCVLWRAVSRFHGVGFHVWVLVSRIGHVRCPGTALPRDRHSPAATGPPGLHTTTRELQTCTFERTGASNSTKIPREDLQRGRKRTNFAGREGKKRVILGPPPLQAPTLRTPPFEPHFFWVWVPTLGAPYPLATPLELPPPSLPRPPHTWSTTGPPTTTQHTQEKPEQLISKKTQTLNSQ